MCLGEATTGSDLITAAQCTGGDLTSSGDFHFCYGAKGKTYAAAAAFCGDRGLELVQPHTAALSAAVDDVCKNGAGKDCTWLDLSCAADSATCDAGFGSWAWKDGTPLSSGTNAMTMDTDGTIRGGGKNELCAHWWEPEKTATWGPQTCTSTYYGALCVAPSHSGEEQQFDAESYNQQEMQFDEPPMQGDGAGAGSGASPVLLQTKAAAIMQLEVIAKKYVNAESYNKLQADNVFSKDKTSKAIGFIVELEAELAKEESTVASAVAADIAAAGLRKSTDDKAAEKNYSDQEATHVKIVAGFQGVWDAKAAVQSTEQKTYDDLLAKETAAVTAHETAEKIETAEQEIADKKKDADDKASTDYHHDHTSNILALKDSDSAYIADEQADIEALQAIVVKLNLRFASM